MIYVCTNYEQSLCSEYLFINLLYLVNRYNCFECVILDTFIYIDIQGSTLKVIDTHCECHVACGTFTTF